MIYIGIIDFLASALKFFLKFRPIRLVVSVLAVLFISQEVVVRWTPLPFMLAEWFAVKPNLKKADVIIVLSGGADQNRRVLEGVTLGREIHGIILWRQGYAPKILFSGGRVSEKYLNDAMYMKDLAIKLGVPEDAILTEEESRNTLENMRLSKKLMDAKGIRTALLVTSPLHMRRSLFFAGKFGLEAYPAPSPFWIHAQRGREILSSIKIEVMGMFLYNFFDEDTIRKAALFIRESFLLRLL
ncbi:MAG: YdcF family protein [Nitrospinae bacterium]|nr:YdcF family protein [Nitrospinota bacterium]